MVFTTLLEGDDRTQDLAFDESRQRLALILDDGTVRVWHREARKEDWNRLTMFKPQQRPSKVIPRSPLTHEPKGRSRKSTVSPEG